MLERLGRGMLSLGERIRGPGADGPTTAVDGPPSDPDIVSTDPPPGIDRAVWERHLAAGAPPDWLQRVARDAPALLTGTLESHTMSAPEGADAPAGDDAWPGAEPPERGVHAAVPRRRPATVSANARPASHDAMPRIGGTGRTRSPPAGGDQIAPGPSPKLPPAPARPPAIPPPAPVDPPPLRSPLPRLLVAAPPPDACKSGIRAVPTDDALRPAPEIAGTRPVPGRETVPSADKPRRRDRGSDRDHSPQRKTLQPQPPRALREFARVPRTLAPDVRPAVHRVDTVRSSRMPIASTIHAPRVPRIVDATNEIPLPRHRTVPTDRPPSRAPAPPLRATAGNVKSVRAIEGEWPSLDFAGSLPRDPGWRDRHDEAERVARLDAEQRGLAWNG